MLKIVSNLVAAGVLAVATVAVPAAAAPPAAAQSYSYTYNGGSGNVGSFSFSGTTGAYTLTSFSGMVAGVSYVTSQVGIGYVGSQIYVGGKLNGVNTANYGTNDFFETGEFTPNTGNFTDNFTYTSPSIRTSAVTGLVAFTQVVAAAAPESATWAMMIIGFGLAGTALRRRRQVATRVLLAA